MPRAKTTKESAVKEDSEETKPVKAEPAVSTLDKDELEIGPVATKEATSFTDRDRSSTESKKGVLELMSEGYGFLRANGLTQSPDDIYISQSQIRRFDIRPGDEVEGQVRPPKETERYYGMLKVEKVNGVSAEKTTRRPRFETLTAVYPNKQLKLETEKLPLSTRMVDLLAPIGFGQRGMIVSPPKAGKTTILKDIANGVAKNYPDTHLMAVLIGERPEEVTDITRSIKGEVLSSNFEDPPEHQ